MFGCSKSEVRLSSKVVNTPSRGEVTGWPAPLSCWQEREVYESLLGYCQNNTETHWLQSTLDQLLLGVFHVSRQRGWDEMPSLAAWKHGKGGAVAEIAAG